MDSENKFIVLSSNSITDFGIIVELENVENGLIKEGVLKSVSSNLFWEIQNRIIEHNFEKRFEQEKEMETIIHINYTNLKNDFSELQKLKKEKSICIYRIKPIGHKTIPILGESLVFHATTFRKKIRIIDIYDDYFLLENNEGYRGVIPKRKVTRRAIAEIGHYIRHCEHQYHDLVDENENFIY